jgi:hypothetical protein
MGNNSGGGTAKDVQRQAPSGEDLLRKLNDLSGEDKRSNSQGTISFHGINRYLNQQSNTYPDDQLPPRKEFLHCRERYDAVKELVQRQDLGFSGPQQEKILVDAYNRLNRNPNKLPDFGALEKSGVVHPMDDKTIGSITANNNNDISRETHGHRTEQVERLDALLKNPHSYVSLSEQKRDDLLKLKDSELNAVLKADESFVKATTDSWRLPLESRGDTKRKIGEEYNAELCHKITEAKETNRAPTEAFLSGKGTLLRAIDNGFDVFDKQSGNDKATTLKAFGLAAQAINLAVNPVSTQLSGRVDTQFVQFDDPTGMTFSNDQVVKSNSKPMQHH